MTNPDSPRVLLIEDNPGDARYIEELLSEATEVSRRIVPAGDGGVPAAGESAATSRARGGGADANAAPPADDGVSMTHESRLAAGIDRLTAESFDAVLLDLHLPDSTGLETLSRVNEEDPDTPIVVLTGVSDRETGIDALRRGAEEYLVKDEINADVLVRSVAHAVERKASERRLQRQRERLAAINHLNRVVHGVTGAVIERSTREEIERIACERIAESASYAFAWIGERDAATDAVQVRAAANAGSYLDDLEISLDPDDPTSRGPTGRALLSGEVCAVDDIREDPDYEPWSDAAAARGVRSSAAIPIVHEETIYGVLNVYATRSDAFRDEERTVLTQLGEVIGHAIAAADRKRALMSDSVVELELRIPNALAELGATETPVGTMTLDRILPVADDEYVAYVSVPTDDIEFVDRVQEAAPNWRTARRIGEGEQSSRFEVRLSEAPVASTLAGLGGSIEEMVISDGDVRVTAHLSQNVGVRRVVEAVRETFPDAEPVARRQVTNAETPVDADADSVLAELTDRQRTVLETAYFSGYFEWPRETSGEEVAEMLDISAATFSQHLRTAERKSFEQLLEQAGESRDPPA
ncbi:hypothetical protein JCM17823_29680 [Halorubrum gandharaense]